MITFIYGPQGCGKTVNAAKLAEFYGAKHIIDECGAGFDLGSIPDDSLVMIQDFYLDKNYHEILEVADKIIPYGIAIMGIEKGEEK